MRSPSIVNIWRFHCSPRLLVNRRSVHIAVSVFFPSLIPTDIQNWSCLNTANQMTMTNRVYVGCIEVLLSASH